VLSTYQNTDFVFEVKLVGENNVPISPQEWTLRSHIRAEVDGALIGKFTISVTSTGYLFLLPKTVTSQIDVGTYMFDILGANQTTGLTEMLGGGTFEVMGAITELTG